MATVVVAGALANKPWNGGEAWVRLSWVLGFLALGCDAYLLEEIAAADDRQRRYFEAVVTGFGLERRAALLESEVPLPVDVVELGRRADLLVNISGHLRREPLFSSFRRKVYVDLDPGFTQIWDASGLDAGLAGHDCYFTVGENIAGGNELPSGRIDWMPARQPVVLDHWPATNGGGRAYTTVASWRGAYGPVELDGRRFGVKAHELRKLAALPGRTAVPLEIALDIDAGDVSDRELLERHGWRLTDPIACAGTPTRFRRYLQESRAELSASQGVYVDTRCGWFSDRTARYLASGKPAIVQDTGFGSFLPVGEGLLAFRTPDDAAACVEEIERDYGRHARAARLIAEEHFESGRVLSRFLAEAGVA